MCALAQVMQQTHTLVSVARKMGNTVCMLRQPFHGALACTQLVFCISSLDISFLNIGLCKPADSLKGLPGW